MITSAPFTAPFELMSKPWNGRIVSSLPWRGPINGSNFGARSGRVTWCRQLRSKGKYGMPCLT